VASDAVKEYEKLRAELEGERDTWLSHWRDLGDYILPRHTRFVTSDRNDGKRKDQNIIDNTATYAARTLAFGMMSGITSPSRPWFKLGLEDPDLMKFSPVKGWLWEVETRIRDTMIKSNIYNVLPNTYLELGTFGTSAFGLYNDAPDVLRGYPAPIGSYSIGMDSRLQVNAIVREFQMTTFQMVQRFGVDALSTSSRALYDQGMGGKQKSVDVIHAVAPNSEADPSKIAPNRKAWRSVFYEKGDNSDGFLRDSGFDEFPYMVPRWITIGEDSWGSSPAMDCLGDTKGLQHLQKMKAKAIEKGVDPPMVGPSSLRNKSISQLPGKVTYDDSLNERTGLRRLHEIDFNIGGVLEDITEHHQRINRTMFTDLFLMLAMSDRREITAREIEERHQEKLVQLGPILERLNDELLDPLVDRYFSRMAALGMFPPAPEEIQGREIKVEYVSILAQAQKLVGLASIERTIGYVTTVSQFKPEVVDKIDFDESVDVYADATGIPAGVVRSDEEVAEIRELRDKQQAVAAQAQLEKEAAGVAKDLSRTDTSGGNALTDILGGSVVGAEGS
jgi:hypothetical protein